MRPRVRALEVVAALALLVLCLVLRLPHGELAEWKGDEAIHHVKARAIAREGERPDRGLHTTDGPRMPVHYLYLLAAPLVLADGPEAIRAGMALLHAGAIVLVFLVGKRDLGRRAALAGALLLATLPEVVRRGRWSWNPNLVLPIGLLVLLALARTAGAPRSRGAAALLPLAALLGLVHYSPVGVAALGALAFAWAWRQGAPRAVLATGLLLALGVAAPHVLAETRNGFRETRAALAVPRSPGERPDPDRRPAAYFERLAAELDPASYARALGPEGQKAARGPALEAAENLAFWALLALGGAGALLALRERGPATVVLASGVAGWLPFLVLRLPSRPHYVQTSVAAALLLGGAALARARRPGPRALAALVALGVSSTGVLAVEGTLGAVARGHAEPGSEHELPLGEKLEAVRLVLEGDFELARWRRFEDVILLEEAYRELARRDPARASAFELVTRKIPYWESVVRIPRPRDPRARVALVAVGPESVPGEVARTSAGHLALVRVGD